jgi:hypothetical protein
MSSNLLTSIPNQATDQSMFTDRTPLLKPDFMHRVFSNQLHATFNLQFFYNLYPMVHWVDDVFDTH